MAIPQASPRQACPAASAAYAILTDDWLEWQDWADPIIAAPFKVADGTIEVPNRPGAGIEWNEDAVRRYQYDLTVSCALAGLPVMR